MQALLLALILVLLMGYIVGALTYGNLDDLGAPILTLTSMLAVLLAVGLTERRTKHTGEKR